MVHECTPISDSEWGNCVHNSGGRRGEEAFRLPRASDWVVAIIEENRDEFSAKQTFADRVPVLRFCGGARFQPGGGKKRTGQAILHFRGHIRGYRAADD